MSFYLQVFLFSSLSLLLASLILKSYFSSIKSHKNMPPSPPKLPIIGNLHQVATGLPLHHTFRTMARTYGPLISLSFGNVPVVVASSVDAAIEILKTHDITFSNRPFSTTGNKFSYDTRDIIMSPYGEYWRQLKSMFVVHAASNKKVQSYRQMREYELTHIIKKIQDANGSVIDISEMLDTLMLNVMCRVAFGRTYEDTGFKKMVKRISHLASRFPIGDFFPLLAWIDKFSGLHREVDAAAKELDRFFETAIDEHVNKKEFGVEGKDLIDILLEMQRDNATSYPIERYMIKAMLMDMFSAGTETTFSTLEWAVAELLRNPLKLKILQQEVRKIGQGRSMIPEDDLDKMPYVKAALKEALRLHAPAPLLMPRVSSKDNKILGYDVPAGTQVFVNVWAIGTDPSIWEEADEFRPERFLNTTTDYKGLHFEYIPFGAGRRGCPGINFAMTLTEFVLANLVYKFDFALSNEDEFDMTESVGVNALKKSPILVTATPCE